MNYIIALDLDRTISRFPATSRLFKRLCLTPIRPGAAAWGLLMLVLMHGFWFWPAAVRFQRRIVMSLFSRVPSGDFDRAVAQLVQEVVDDFKDGLGAQIDLALKGADAVYIVSHCPQPLGTQVAAALSWQEAYGVPVRDYMRGASGDVYDKVQRLESLKAEHPGAALWYYADDLVDLPALRACDVGTLVNGSRFSRWVSRYWAPEVRIC